MIKLGAKELRLSSPSAQDLMAIKRKPIYLILDNVLDTYNIGSIFRLADAVGAKKVFLCGETATPPNHRVKKASVGTWPWVPWSHAPSAPEALKKLKNRNKKVKIIAVEQSRRSVWYDEAKYEFPLAIVVGNETYGVSQEVLAMADQIVEIPMFGVNKSLNVMVSCAIVLFEAIKSEKRRLGEER